MIERLIDMLIARIEPKVIGGECVAQRGPLMTRWFLFRSGPVSVMIHRFHRSDYDRHFHDHPWRFISFLIGGGYWEHTPAGGRRWKPRFSVLFRPATWQHWVEIERPVYTLVIKLRTVRDWGFITPQGWIKWNVMNWEEICDE